MGWRIEIKDEKYRVYSTIVDDYISDYMDKNKLIRFLFWHRFEGLMREMLEDIIAFPNKWIDKETGKYLNCDKEKSDKFYALLENRKKMFEYFFTKIKEAGITLYLQDIDGVDIHTESDKK
jgi:hypothetical protein